MKLSKDFTTVIAKPTFDLKCTPIWKTINTTFVDMHIYCEPPFFKKPPKGLSKEELESLLKTKIEAILDSAHEMLVNRKPDELLIDLDGWLSEKSNFILGVINNHLPYLLRILFSTGYRTGLEIIRPLQDQDYRPNETIPEDFYA
jgi:hypothetical protein